MGVQKARENFVKIENETKLKFKKRRNIRHIYRVGDLIRYNRKILEKSFWMRPVKIIAINKGIFICRHKKKRLVRVHYSRVKPARDWDNDGGREIECWSKTGKTDQRAETDNNSRVKITGDRTACGICIEEYVDMKRQKKSVEQTAANSMVYDERKFIQLQSENKQIFLIKPTLLAKTDKMHKIG